MSSGGDNRGGGIGPAREVALVGGPTEVGKTAIVSCLIKRYPDFYARPISYTTRAKRPGEDESEYDFVNPATLERMHEQQKLLAIDEVYGDRYATSRESVAHILEGGRMSIKEVHPANHEKLRLFYPELLSILLLSLPGQSNSGQNAERLQRGPIDHEFYAALDIRRFDIVLHVDRSQAVTTVANNLHVALQAVSMAKTAFPRARDIDAVNSEGYSRIATEFTEDQRVTTRNFHDLSLAFFRRSISTFLGAASRCLEIGPGQGWLRRSVDWPQAQYDAVDLCQEMAECNSFDNVSCCPARPLYSLMSRLTWSLHRWGIPIAIQLCCARFDAS